MWSTFHFPELLEDLIGKSVVSYIDDILVFSKTKEEHLDTIQEIFRHFRVADLKTNTAKGQWLQEQVKFLGHIVSEKGIATDPDKIQAARDWSSPRTIRDV